MARRWLFALLGMVLPACDSPTPPVECIGEGRAAPSCMESVQMTLYVGSSHADCVGVGPRKCLLVKATPDGAYEFFYDNIEGLTFEPGFNYTLRVERRLRPVPVQDSGIYTWHLIQVLSKTPAGNSPSQSMQQFLQQIPAQIAHAIATNNDLLPRNPNSAAQIQAKLVLLQRPGLASDIVTQSLYHERTALSMRGTPIPVMTIFTADSMRAGAAAALDYLADVQPRLESYFNMPFPPLSIRVWYGFTLGNSGGGGLINMEDRGTYESRTGPARLPFNAILAHELAHSYIGNEALTQFLELTMYNAIAVGSADVSQWVFTRDYAPGAANNSGVHALLDIYRLIGNQAMQNAYRAIYPLRPPYGSPLSQAVRDAFLTAVQPAHRTQVAAKLATITF
jgi:hypothetical protein